ncbi:MAG TPA: hypothetical protein VGN43_08080, partial [Steroidobacteraceae bacterium]|nr:hypothetical protein [Steroidobacteraceae bacterium]
MVDTSSIERNSACIRNLIEGVINAGRLDLCDRYLAADRVDHHDYGLPPGDADGREGLWRTLSANHLGQKGVVMGRLAATTAVVMLVLAVPRSGMAASVTAHHPGHPRRQTSAADGSGFVPIGGIDQWIQIRGDDRHNSVLLWLKRRSRLLDHSLHTGAHRQWERAFTLVMWDQRGEGKTFERSGESIALAVKRGAVAWSSSSSGLAEPFRSRRCAL